MSISIQIPRPTEGKHGRDENEDYFSTLGNDMIRRMDRRSAIPKRFEDRSFAQKRKNEGGDANMSEKRGRGEIEDEEMSDNIRLISAENIQDSELRRKVRTLCYYNLETFEDAVHYYFANRDNNPSICQTIKESATDVSNAFHTNSWKIVDCEKIFSM